MANTVKIMSFNMRLDVERDGENRFLYRKEFIADFLSRVKPDVIGFQEITTSMRSWMVDTLQDYYVVGSGREANDKGECVCIAFLKSRFALMECETFWLSPTPNTPGSRFSGDQSTCPRICTWAALKPAEGNPFRIYNMHTDHSGISARLLATNQLLQKIGENNQKRPMKSFITGDFNARPEEPSVRSIAEYSATPFVDLAAQSGQTFHGFGRFKNENCKIDYIFAEKDVPCTALQKFEDTRGSLYLSDHTPIMATVLLD